MKRYDNILVAFDGSTPSIRALETAETLAIHYKSRLTVVFVHDYRLEPMIDRSSHDEGTEIDFYIGSEPATAYSFPIPENDEYGYMVEHAPEKVLTNANSRLSNDIGANFVTLVGNPADKLITYAKNNEIDLIIMGHRGLSGFKKFMIGSVSHKVTNKAKCSVFVVK